ASRTVSGDAMEELRGATETEVSILMCGRDRVTGRQSLQSKPTIPDLHGCAQTVARRADTAYNAALNRRQFSHISALADACYNLPRPIIANHRASQTVVRDDRPMQIKSEFSPIDASSTT